LSRRCLFLTPEGVILVCREGCTSEGTICSPGNDASKQIKIASDLLFSNAGTSRSWPPEELVQAYQARSLKFDSDVLSAFEGVLSSQELSTVLGVPVMTLPLTDHDSASLIKFGFAHGLAWRNLSKDRPGSGGDDNFRTGFPSWSWISRRHAPIEFTYFSRRRPITWHVSDVTTTTIPYSAEFLLQITKAKAKTIADFLAPFIASGADKAINEDIRYIHVTSLIAQWSLETIEDRHCLLRVESSSTAGVELPYWSDPEHSNLFQELGIIGHIHFYNPKRQQCTKGLAILLFVICENHQRQCDTDVAGSVDPDECESSTSWLVIRETDDGSYRREGLIKTRGYLRSCASDRIATNSIHAPPKFDTIMLG
jgi:hypothetical protein